MIWSVYNQSRVRRDEILLGFDIINNWDTELKDMNKDKVCKPFHYPNTFLLLLLGYAKIYFHLLFRQTKEGIAQGHAYRRVPSIPKYSTINRRINKLYIKIKDVNKSKEFEYQHITIAIYSTGIKITNRGQWMQDKWHLNNNKKGYLKMHGAVNVKTKKILSMKVTDDEHVHQSKALPELVENIIESNSVTVPINKLFAEDGAYDGNDIFRYIADNGILSFIKIRKNAKVGWKKGISLEIDQFLHKEMIYKSGRTAKAMDKDGLLKLYFPL